MRARLYLDDLAPLSTGRGAMTFSSQFTLPAGDYGGSALVLEELNWSADVSLNGDTLPTVEGGPGWTRVPIQPVEGPNTLSVTIHAPTETNPVPVARGSRSLDVRVARNPWLDLAPEGGITDFSASLTDGTLSAHVEASGAQVRVLATRDGKVVQDLGRAPLQNGVADLRATWKGPTWDPWDSASPGLVHLWALAEDASGAVLDAVGERTGFRELAVGQGGFTIGDTQTALVGIRVGHNMTSEDAVTDALAAGMNTLEWHGVFFSSEDADHLDELGLALVALPRCDGTIKARPNDIAGQEATFDRQDANLKRSLGWHPAHVLWSSEGGSDAVGPYVAGLEGPNALLGTQDLALSTIPPRNPPSQSWWSIETLAHKVKGQAAEVEAVQEQLGASMVGAIVLGQPNGQPGGAWAETWKAVEEIQPPASTRRGHAVIEQKVPPGEILWVEGVWLPKVGQLSQRGSASVEVWYDGPVIANGVSVEADPGTWTMGTYSR